MDRRLAIAISGSSAAIVLAVGLTAAGFVPGPRSSAQAESASGETDLIAAGQAEVKPAAAKPKTVYVKPAPKPRTVVVKRPARAVPLASTTRSRPAVASRPRRVARSVPRREHEYESREHEREQEAERRKEAQEHQREQERERDDD